MRSLLTNFLEYIINGYTSPYMALLSIKYFRSRVIGLNASRGRINWGISEDIPQFLKPMDNKHNSLNEFLKKLWHYVDKRVKQKFGFIKQVDKD